METRIWPVTDALAQARLTEIAIVEAMERVRSYIPVDEHSARARSAVLDEMMDSLHLFRRYCLKGETA